MPVSPDCSNYPFKCPACSGDAWDDAADEMTPCACPCHAPTPRDPDVTIPPCAHPVRDSADGLCAVCGIPLPERPR